MFARHFPDGPQPAPPRSAGTGSSNTDGGGGRAQDRSFQRLKPICVQLLSFTSSTRGSSKEQRDSLSFCLKRLRHVLADLAGTAEDGTDGSGDQVGEHDTPLTPSLIHYVFFPIAQILRASPGGVADLPDQSQQLVFECLSLLASQWWRAWIDPQKPSSSMLATQQKGASAEWAVWQQLVILAALAIGGPPGKPSSTGSPPSSRFSDETKRAAVALLLQLLHPRFDSLLQKSKAEPTVESKHLAKAKQEDWEWDGESELPTLEQLEAEEAEPAEPALGTQEAQSSTGHQQRYPSRDQLYHSLSDTTAKGALGHALTSCIELACQGTRMLELRLDALRVAHIILTTWIGAAIVKDATASSLGTAAACRDSERELGMEAPQFIEVGDAASAGEPVALAEQAANRVRPLLPGITSSLTRLITSRLKDAAAGSSTNRRETPGVLAAAALAMLGDLLILSLGDVTTQSYRERVSSPIGFERQTLGQGTSDAQPAIPKMRTLDDFAAVAEKMADGVWEKGHSVAPGEDEDEGTAAEPPAAAARQASDAPMEKEEAARKYLLSTLARIQIALRSFSSLAAPFTASSISAPPVHVATRRGLLRLAASLLVHAGETLSWFDAELRQQGSAKTESQSALGLHESAIEMLLTWIVDSAGEDDIDSVRQDARAALSVLLGPTIGRALDQGDPGTVTARTMSALSDLTGRALTELPKAIRAQEDSKVQRLSIRLSTTVGLASGSLPSMQSASSSFSFEMAQALAHLFGPTGGVERWGTALAGTMKIGISSLSASSSDAATNWPPRPTLDGLGYGSSRSVLDMFRAFGRACASLAALQARVKAETTKRGATSKTNRQAFHIVIFFVRRGALFRTCRVDASGAGDVDALRTQSMTALMIASELLRGVAEELDDAKLATQSDAISKRLRKTAHTLGREIFQLVMDLLEADWEEVIDTSLIRVHGNNSGESGDSGGQAGAVIEGVDADAGGDLVERVKGLSVDVDHSESPERFGPALDLAFVKPATITAGGAVRRSSALASSEGTTVATRASRAEASLNMANAHLLSLLSSASMLLGTSFRPLLLRAMYPLTSGLASPHEGLRSAAEMAFRDVAYSSAYASVQSCVLDHADYLLGAACQRLVSGLDEELRAHFLVPAVGSQSRSDGTAASSSGATLSIVPLVSAQRAPFVLVEMIRMLGSEVVPLVEDAVDEIMDALDRFHAYRDVCTGLLGVLDGVLEVMASEEAQLQLDRAPDPAPKPTDVIADFERWYRLQTGAATQDEQEEHEEICTALPENHDDDSKEKEPSKTQQVVRQIMVEGIPFLSHPSAQLRASVLQLLRHGVAVLGSQRREAELMPVVNDFWPILMARLGRSYTSSYSSFGRKDGRILDLDAFRRRQRQATKRDAAGSGGRGVDNEDEAGLSESEPFVWVEAVRLVETLSMHVSAFLAKKVETDAWPRFETLLSLVYRRFGPLSSSRAPANAGRLPPSTAAASAKDQRSRRRGTPPLIFPSSNSLPAQIATSICTTLATVVDALGVRMSEDVAWRITRNAHILACLDHRQPDSVRAAAERLMAALARRNWDATWLVLISSFGTEADEDDDGAKQRQWLEETAYLRQDWIELRAGTMDRLLQV